MKKTRLEISKKNLHHNLSSFKKLLAPDCKIMVMVKANAYGLGALMIAEELKTSIHYLAVATIDEGIELREHGALLPILVLNPDPERLFDCQTWDLEIQINNFYCLEKLPTSNTPIHINLDTGMHRLGFLENEIDKLVSIIKVKNLEVKSIYSHFVGSGNPDLIDFSHQQAKRFENSYQKICSKLNYFPTKHLVNSEGLLYFPQYQFDMVRLGIGLFGGIEHESLKSIATLKTYISQIKFLKKGESAGYNKVGITPYDGYIATLPIGYADGFLRKAGNGRYTVKVGKHFFPTLGNISMDATVIFIGSKKILKEGEEVIIFGVSPSAIELAQVYETISYEVLTGIGKRVERLFV